MTDEIRALLARHRPGYDVTTEAKLGEGLDNITYDIYGELIVRRSKEADHARRSEAIGREADLLAVVARFSTLPVPEANRVSSPVPKAKRKLYSRLRPWRKPRS